MCTGDAENSTTVLLGQGEIITHAEEHQRADGLTHEEGGLGDQGQEAGICQHLTDAQQIQGQTQQAEHQHGGGEDLLEELTDGGFAAGIGGEDAHDGDADEALCQVQNAHAVGLGGAEEDDGQGDAQHAGFLAAGQQGQVVIGQELLIEPEGQHCCCQGEGDDDDHGAQRLAADLAGEAGVEQHAGDTDADDEILQTLDLILGHDLLHTGQDTQSGGKEDGKNDQGDVDIFFHGI